MTCTTRERARDDDDIPKNMLLLTSPDNNTTEKSKALAKALLQTADSTWHGTRESTAQNSMDAKVVTALQRTLNDQPSTRMESSQTKRTVHVMEYPTQVGGADPTNRNLLGQTPDHIGMVLSASEWTGYATTERLSESNRKKSKQKTPSLWGHPLLQRGLHYYTKCAKNRGETAEDIALWMPYRISVILLVSHEDEVEDSSTLQYSSALLHTADHCPGGSRKQKFTATVNASPTVFLCRPDDLASYQSVSRMLWRRLEILETLPHRASLLLLS